MYKKKYIPLFFLLPLILLNVGCPRDKIDPLPTPPEESVIPTPVVIPSIDPYITNIYKIEFGPGTKGINDFGPGTKGISEFGPGSKGINNLRFDINMPSNLISNNIETFSTKSVNNSLLFDKLEIDVIKGEEKLGTIIVLPYQNKLKIDTVIKPGNYKLIVRTIKNDFVIESSEKFVEVLENYHAEARIAIFAEEPKPELLDIEILTRNKLLPNEIDN